MNLSAEKLHDLAVIAFALALVLVLYGLFPSSSIPVIALILFLVTIAHS